VRRRAAGALALALAAAQPAAAEETVPAPGLFGRPEPDADFETLSNFRLGKAAFDREWTVAGAGSATFDGLGPLYNSPSCAACHAGDGRGRPPDDAGTAVVSLLARLARARAGEATASAPDPQGGYQLQDRAVPGTAPEGRLRVAWEAVPFTLADDAQLSLRRPHFTVAWAAGTAPSPDLRIGLRLAPPLIGLGLLERVPEADVLAAADPDDRDGDGISGRANEVASPSLGRAALGRFGWKASQATVRDQIALALFRDMGLSSRLRPDGHGDCTAAQAACRRLAEGAAPGEPEAADAVLDFLTAYASNLAVPARRRPQDPDVAAGEALFAAAGCPGCHRPELTTGTDPDAPHLSNRRIRPYTDLLLHDMGPDLADGIGEAAASGSEWRTAPLWGVGLAGAVNGNAVFLHDGRARSVAEAVAWHGGEAAAARAAFAAMAAEDRARLVLFVDSL